MTKNGKPEFAMLLKKRTEPGKYGNPTRFIARAELVTLDPTDGSPRNITSGSLFDGTLGLEGIVAVNSLPEDWASRGETGYFDLKFEAIIGYTLREMVAGGKVAARVQRKLDAMDVSLGRPTSFGAFVLRVAQALGVSTFTWQTSPMDYGTYSSASWYRATPGEASRWLDAAETAYIDRHRATVAV